MPRNCLVPVALALALAGCGSVGAIGLGPMNRNPPADQVEMGGLPPATPQDQPPAAAAPPATGGAVAAEPQAADPNAADGAVASASPAAKPAAGAAGGGIARTDLLGGWTITAGGDSCQLFMTLTSWTGGYRASTRGCNNATLKSISAWNLDGKQVILAGTGGAPVAHLSSSGNGRFDGQADGGGGTVTFFR
jgi:hypothetical protein